MPTLPLGSTLNMEVVAEPLAFVEDAMSKSARPDTPVRWTPREAKDVVVPSVTSLPKRLGIVVDAFAMSPCVKATMVDVATMAVFAVEVKGQAKSALLLNVVQSAAVRRPRTVAEEDGS